MTWATTSPTPCDSARLVANSTVRRLGALPSIPTITAALMRSHFLPAGVRGGVRVIGAG